MSEWWTYELSDFLLFSHRVYVRLFELHNEALWPAQVVTLLIGAGILGAMVNPGRLAPRVVPLALGTLWLWIAWSFFGQRYATINWAALYVAPVFAAQGLALIALAAGPGPRPGGPAGHGAARSGRIDCIGARRPRLSARRAGSRTAACRGGSVRHRPGSDGSRHTRHSQHFSRTSAVATHGGAPPMVRHHGPHALDNGRARGLHRTRLGLVVCRRGRRRTAAKVPPADPLSALTGAWRAAALPVLRPSSGSIS
jgi:hypothetical protein